MASPGLSSGTLTLSHTAKVQLLSKTLPCFQNQYCEEDSYTLGHLAASMWCSPGLSEPQLLCAGPEEVFAENVTSVMLVSF